MSAIPKLNEAECYLAAVLDDPSGIELAELTWVDEEQEDRCFRLWDFQWALYRCEEIYQIDHMGRGLGKSNGLIMRAFAFPFNYPGREMLITAPELNHLRPITDKVEHALTSTKIGKAMLPKRRGQGINHQPQFQAHFINNARIVSRLPNRDGRGLKGCIGEGALILTARGHVPVEELVAGDEVMTHMGRWRKLVSATPVRDVAGYHISGGGNRDIFVSRNHQMLTRWDRTEGRKKRDLDDPDWTIMEAPLRGSDLQNHYLGSPTDFPQLPIPARLDSEEILWIVGRYLADGYLSFATRRGIQTSGRVHIIVPPEKLADAMNGASAAGLRPSCSERGNGTFNVEFSDTSLARLFESELGRHSYDKTCPTWILGAPEGCRAALLNGYLMGDGSWDRKKRRYTFGSASKNLALGMKLLGQTLGYSAGLSWTDPQVSEICGQALKAEPRRSHTVRLSEHGTAAQCVTPIPTAWQKVRTVKQVDLPVVYDLSVEEDCSYVADGLIHHNQHPLVIEMDESQDMPEGGWVEIVETMKSASKGAQWRSHGVSRGLRDRYYKYTMGEDPDIPFYVHRYMAMHRPSWGPAERKAKIAIYGGTEDNIDYRRNIFGDHGDASATLFVLNRLMAAVRINESKWATEYNDEIYTKIKINDELLKNSGALIETFIQLPGSHLDKKYFNFWGGMDIGFTRDPSELLIFGETDHPTKKGESLMRLLLRIHLMRISAADQAAVIRSVFGFYGDRLRRFSMDRTGNGLPLWQELDPAAVGTHVSRRRTEEHISKRIKGYGFSNKVAVEFDDRELVGKERPEDAVISKNVISFASDELRKLVDTHGLELPYDRELLTEWQGQEIEYVRDEGSASGIKTKMVGGSLHTLDAAFMMVAGKQLMGIEEALKITAKAEPIMVRFGD